MLIAIKICSLWRATVPFKRTALVVVALLSTSCNLQGNSEPTPAPSPTSTAVEKSTLATAPATGAAEEISLTVWTPPFFTSAEDSPAGTILQSAYRLFQEKHPDVHLEVLLKAEAGPTGFYQYLQTAGSVAPSILPDVMLINTQAMWRIVADFELVLPLSQDEYDILLDQVYPFARDAVRYNQQIYGIPYVASVTHVAYYRSNGQADDLSAVVPSNWKELLDSNKIYIFPAAGENNLSSDMLLLQYVGAGGQLTVDGTLSNSEALTALLNFMAGGSERGQFSPESVEVSTYDAALEAFLAQKADMVNLTSEQFLNIRNAMTDVDYAPVPTRSGSVLTIAHVWAFVVLSSDPEKRALALEFVQNLLDPQVHSGWSQNALRLPTQMAAFELWEESQPYHSFLRQLLDVALSVPNGQPFADLSQKLQSVQLKVLRGELSIQDAVDQLANQQ